MHNTKTSIEQRHLACVTFKVSLILKEICRKLVLHFPCQKIKNNAECGQINLQKKIQVMHQVQNDKKTQNLVAVFSLKHQKIKHEIKVNNPKRVSAKAPMWLHMWLYNLAFFISYLVCQLV